MSDGQDPQPPEPAGPRAELAGVETTESAPADPLATASDDTANGASAPVDAAPTSIVALSPAPVRPSRRRFLKYALAAAAVPTLGALYSWRAEPTWVQYHDLPMPLPNLPASFHGLRLTHLTDLHVGEEVPLDYLRTVIARVNADRPDLVVVTGDLITHAQQQWIDPAVDLLAELRPPVYVSLGNHDYGIYRRPGPARSGSRWTADVIERRLTERGMTVLRNRAVAIDRPDGRLWMTGLDDFWGGYYRPEAAFGGINRAEPVIVLSHNPDTAMNLDTYEPDWILCGHTHGGQVRLPFIGAPIMPISHREFDQGQFQLTHARLYVSRGVGYLLRIRFMCRPEVPTFVLQAV